MNESKVDFKEVCEPPKPQNLIFPGELRTMWENVQLCQRMRGSISVIRNESTQSMMIVQFENYQHQMGIHSESEFRTKYRMIEGHVEPLKQIANESITLHCLAVGFWAGWTDELTEGRYIDPNTGEEMYETTGGFHPFHPGEPNGGSLENCIQVWPHKNSWNDYRCGYRAASFCNIEGRPRFKIRGLHCELNFRSVDKNMYLTRIIL